ncbi:MAG: peptidase C15 [Gomphosphaeria aponina SAG 52.96 = DSM 107014]|uniref:Peptidase C15 n=1 Tax=Gomphosphaeria aponina SAG 52.96 = DSM 107014 TaxID=1521640 RepID=A0A941GUL1_9CHRO|nr:peptidase C15 [Gomphosphaeria aponina SAG 52.96 = DSM 107014]
MPKKILLTSFNTWLPHQSSNSSDDLLIKFQNLAHQYNLIFARQLPVDIGRASERAIKYIKYKHPNVVICCGMAESRYQLTLESNATWTNDKINTSVNLNQLLSSLSYTAISHNAGKFVCEGLYYQVLKELLPSPTQCIFVHIPVITYTNLPKILTDFLMIIENLS